jgi:hypothetical protein
MHAAVGAHARGGSPTFFSHTIMPGLRLRVGDELLSESHWWAWTGDVPVLGIVGSAGLGAGLGSLSDVPFLAVQESPDRGSARPLFSSPRETAEAIEAFAHAAVRNGAGQRARAPRARAPRGIVLEASLHNADDAAEPMTAAGWIRTSRTEFLIEAPAWRSEGEPIEKAIEAAVVAGWEPFAFSLDGVDPSSRSTGLAFPSARRAQAAALFETWTNEVTADWITPESPIRWEGFDADATRSA